MIRSPHCFLFSLIAPVIALVTVGTSFGAPPPGLPDGWSDGFVYANGIRIHYYHAIPAPGKPVIVMVHGVSDIGLSWTTLTWKLQDAYDIYMVDVRGHGLSDPFTPTDNRDTLVKDVVEFVHVMKFEKPILMGHSMGAATVMRLGAEYPDLARAIIMLDPLLGPLAPPPPAVSAADSRAGASDASKPAASPAPTTSRRSNSFMGPPESLVAQNNTPFDTLVAKCHHDSPKWDLVDCQYWALSKKQYHGPYTPEAQQVMTGVMQIGDSLSKITVPSLILKADASPEVRKHNEEIARVLQHGKLVHVDGAAHNLHHDQLARTVELLKEFLSSL